jgi:hypothetical protein
MMKYLMYCAHHLYLDALSMLKVFTRKLRNTIVLMKTLKNPYSE